MRRAGHVDAGEDPAAAAEREVQSRAPRWLTLDEVPARDVTTPVRFMIERDRPALLAPIAG